MRLILAALFTLTLLSSDTDAKTGVPGRRLGGGTRHYERVYMNNTTADNLAAYWAGINQQQPAPESKPEVKDKDKSKG